jgi:hypothetical protein
MCVFGHLGFTQDAMQKPVAVFEQPLFNAFDGDDVSANSKNH